MKKTFTLSIALVMIALVSFSLTAVPAEAASKVVVHFIVVPAKAQSGAMPGRVLADFRNWLAETAGGYTQLGPTNGGFLPPGGKLQISDNHSFIVSAPKNISAEIEAFAEKLFGGQKPYILTWPADSNY